MELPLKIGVCGDEAAVSTNAFPEAARFGRATVEVAGNLSASTKKKKLPLLQIVLVVVWTSVHVHVYMMEPLIFTGIFT